MAKIELGAVTESEISAVQAGSTETTIKTERFSIGGMTCTACQARVQRKLSQELGVVSASVNLLLKSADVTFAGLYTWHGDSYLLDFFREVGVGSFGFAIRFSSLTTCGGKTN